jgi:hypothetical protein
LGNTPSRDDPDFLANRKWARNVHIGRIVLATLQAMNPTPPHVDLDNITIPK